MSTNRKEPDFVVTDRRKFTEEGVRREEAPEAAPEIPAADTARVVSEKFSKEDVERQTGRAAPSEAEQATQHADYRAGSQRLDDLLQERTGQSAAAAEMTFERLVASLYMTAMMQLGMMVPEGEEPRIDILGARQTIDVPVITLLQQLPLLILDPLSPAFGWQVLPAAFDNGFITFWAAFGWGNIVAPGSIYAALSDKSKQAVLQEFGGGQFSGFKNALVELCVTKLSPIAGEMKRLVGDPGHVDKILTDGSDRARARAAETMKSVKDIVGFVHRR